LIEFLAFEFLLNHLKIQRAILTLEIADNDVLFERIDVDLFSSSRNCSGTTDFTRYNAAQIDEGNKTSHCSSPWPLHPMSEKCVAVAKLLRFDVTIFAFRSVLVKSSFSVSVVSPIAPASIGRRIEKESDSHPHFNVQD
jgi:hypothetical protein